MPITVQLMDYSDRITEVTVLVVGIRAYDQSLELPIFMICKPKIDWATC